MRILPAWLREFVDIAADDRQLAEDLTSAGIAVETVVEEHGATVYEMDLTTNRVDAMNHYGVAREASAIYGVELKPFQPKLLSADRGPSTSAAKDAPPSLRMTPGENFPIVIEDAEGCARYTARIIRGVKIGPSPEHIVKRLELLGSRAINNAADATNYAINELGHPTHAFDLDLLEGGKIIVRRARDGELLKTLDGVGPHADSTDDLVIADAEKPVALAGVMGGFDSMITEKTKNVLIESAWFDPATVRSMAKRHGMHTDASHRFERGADWGITPVACDRVAELILETAGGELAGERIDTVARKVERPPIALRRSEVKRILGIDIQRQRDRAHPAPARIWRYFRQRRFIGGQWISVHRRQRRRCACGRGHQGERRFQRDHSHMAARRGTRDRSAGRAGAHLRLQQVSQHAAVVHRRGGRAA